MDFEQLATLKQHAYMKLGQMIDYAQVRSCRHAYITDYFGEATTERSCHSCDNCERSEEIQSAAAPVDAPVIRAALAGATRFAGRMGMVNLASILAGKENRFSREQPWVVHTPVYGSLAGWSQARLRRLLEELVAAGCLAQSQGQYPMVVLTERGRAVLGGAETVAISIDAEVVPATSPAADPALFQRLREWRAAVARRQGIAAFMVFHDRTLGELAARRPSDLSQLEAVPGIGPSKLNLYGEALLEILAN
jgi:ATP-dependent DNA helicase RecQ